MSTSGINRLSLSSLNYTQMAIGATAAFAALGLFFLFQRHKSVPSTSSHPKTDLRTFTTLAPSRKDAQDYTSTNLKNTIVVIPSENMTTTPVPLKVRQELYDDAKKTILSYPKSLLSRVCFRDDRLEMRFKYNVMDFQRLIEQFMKWGNYKFIGTDSIGLFTTICNYHDTDSVFCIKDYDIARQRLEKESRKLHQEARRFFSQFSPQVLFSFGQEDFRNYDELLSAVFAKSQGLSIADKHKSTASRFFLATHMRDLVKQGVDTLFFEGLSYEMQEDLDEYFDPKTDIEAIPFSLFFIGETPTEDVIRSKGGYTILDLLKKAKEAGIKRVVGIDSMLCKNYFSEEASNSEITKRRYRFNYFAKGIIEKEKTQGKYVIFSGASHATTPDTGRRVPGFSQIFGIPSIFFQESSFSYISNSQGKQSWVVFKGDTIKTKTSMVPIHVDFMVNTSPDEQSKPNTEIVF